MEIQKPRSIRFPKTIIYILLLVLAGCAESSETKEESAQPTKEQMVADLKMIHELLSDGEFMTAAARFKGPKKLSQEKIAKAMKGWLKKREISMRGIEVLYEKGKFGKLNEVFPEKGGDWMERNEVTNPDACYGLGYKNAEVAAIWEGGKFTFFRLDDVGKL